MPKMIKFRFKEEQEIEIIDAILANKIFIYPTDTIYGIGCNALHKEAVEKIKNIKQRDKDKPLSIIAPSVEWIKENCILSKEDEKAIEKYLPGPFTLLLKKKNQDFMQWISSNDMIGIRIPNHTITKIIQKSNLPFITTSVNLSGEPFAKSLEEIPEKIKKQVDFIIESKEKLTGIPSILIIDGKKIERK